MQLRTELRINGTTYKYEYTEPAYLSLRRYWSIRDVYVSADGEKVYIEVGQQENLRF